LAIQGIEEVHQSGGIFDLIEDPLLRLVRGEDEIFECRFGNTEIAACDGIDPGLGGLSVSFLRDTNLKALDSRRARNLCCKQRFALGGDRDQNKKGCDDRWRDLARYAI
jgi:hypothetical protein